MALLTRILFTSGMVLLLLPSLFSQEYIISTGTVALYDSGGSGNNCLASKVSSNNNVQNSDVAVQNKLTECQAYQNSIAANISYAHPDSIFLDICKGTEINFTAISDFYSNQTQGYQQTTENTRYIWTLTRGYFDIITEVSGEGLNTFNYSFDEAGGYIVRLRSEDIMQCEADAEVSIRLRVSRPPDFFGSHITPDEICPGHEVLLHGEVSSQTFNMHSAITHVNQCITDQEIIEIPISVNFFDNGNVSIGNVDDIASICMNFEHSYAGDLYIDLFCPTNQSVRLHNYYTCNNSYFGYPNQLDNCEPGTGLQYCWSSSAENPIQSNCQSYNTILPGNYLPPQSFEALIGCPVNGEWKIQIYDNWGSDDGYVFSVELAFNPELFPETEPWVYTISYDLSETTTSAYWSGTGTNGNFGADQVVFPQGENISVPYVFTVSDNFGCTYDTTLILNIRDVRDNLCCPISTPEICYVTTNSNNKAVLYWTNPDWQIDSIYIYKEIDGEYQKIAVIAGTASAYIDGQSKPHLVSEKYRISFWNSCNEESFLSSYHKNMLLNLSYIDNNSFRLNWSAYEGIDIDNIKICRGSTPESILWLATIEGDATEFIDDNLPNGYTHLYYIVDINYHDCSAQSNDRLIRSNIATNNADYYFSISTQMAIPFKISPNPARNTVNVSFEAPNAKLSICDLNGKSLIVKNAFTGGEINIEHLKAGVYVVKLETDEGVGVRKLVVE